MITTGSKIEGEDTLFDSLLKIKDDPDAFNAMTQKIKDDYISTVDPKRQQRLRGLQWKLDQQLNHEKNPTMRLNKMIEIFYEHISNHYGKNGLFVSAVNRLTNPDAEQPVRRKASILKIKKDT